MGAGAGGGRWCEDVGGAVPGGQFPEEVTLKLS